MTAVMDTRMLPLRPPSTEANVHSMEDAWVERAEAVTNGLHSATRTQRRTLITLLSLPADTASNSTFLWGNAIEIAASTATARPIRVPVVGSWLDTMRLVAQPEEAHQEASIAGPEEVAMTVRSQQHKIDRRSAIFAGILSGLGIKPRRPRTPSDRLHAALIRTYQTDAVNARY